MQKLPAKPVQGQKVTGYSENEGKGAKLVTISNFSDTEVSVSGAETQGGERGMVSSKVLGGGNGAAFIPHKISEIFNQIS